MIWLSARNSDQSIKAAAFRAVHERWLTEALRHPERVVRIPVRRVALGGFARLMSRPSGRRAAERWWLGVLGSTDLD